MYSAIPQHLLVRNKANERLQRKDFEQLECVSGLMPKLILYVKDNTRRWIACNDFALAFLNRKTHEEILGTREEDFFPKAIAEAIREDDLRVLGNGERIIDRLELVVNEQGQLVWVRTSKLPIVNESNDILGLVGLTSVLELDLTLPPRFERFKKVVQQIESTLATQLRVSELAATANMSESHFRRSFKQCFGCSPQEFILQQRLRQAARLLVDTDSSVSEISNDCGFADQSNFSRQFGRFFGETPRAYRLHWQ